MSDAIAVVRGMIAERIQIRGQCARQEADALARLLEVAEAAVAYAAECAPYHDNAVLQGTVGDVEQALMDAILAILTTEPTDG